MLAQRDQMHRMPIVGFPGRNGGLPIKPNRKSPSKNRRQAEVERHVCGFLLRRGGHPRIPAAREAAMDIQAVSQVVPHDLRFNIAGAELQLEKSTAGRAFSWLAYR